jgi:hypothetical protein
MMMGRPVGSKNGIVTRVRKHIGIPVELVKVINQFMEDSDATTFSDATVQLIKYGITFYYYFKDK